MTLHIILGKLTQAAIEHLDKIQERVLNVEKLIGDTGGQFIALYYTFGHYDFVMIVDMPSPEAFAKFIFELSTWGTVTTETMTALLPEQIYEVVKQINI